MMRAINDTGLIRVEKHQWPVVEAALRNAGYVRSSEERDKVFADGGLGACVAGFDATNNCWYVDERVRWYLPRPVGRPFRHDPWVDIGGEG